VPLCGQTWKDNEEAQEEKSNGRMNFSMIICNGGFEADTVNDFSFANPSGWTSSVGAGLAPDGNSGIDYISSGKGDNVAFLRVGNTMYSGSIEQTLSGLTTGNLYMFSFMSARLHAVSDGSKLAVQIDGIPILFLKTHILTGGFSTFTFQFVAKAESHTLGFRNVANPELDSTLLLDDIHQTVEPSGNTS
jgi:hypothetical protein